MTIRIIEVTEDPDVAFDDMWRELCYMKHAFNDFSNQINQFIAAVEDLEIEASAYELLVTAGVIRTAIEVTADILGELREACYDEENWGGHKDAED